MASAYFCTESACSVCGARSLYLPLDPDFFKKPLFMLKVFVLEIYLGGVAGRGGSQSHFQTNHLIPYKINFVPFFFRPFWQIKCNFLFALAHHQCITV
jgi:hypothetical protein